MPLFPRKKLPRLIFTVYTALAVIGVFSFAAVDSLRSVAFEMGEPAGDRISGFPDNRLFQYSAEEPALVAETSETQFPSMRMGFQRFASAFGLLNIGNAFSKSSFAANANIYYINPKNTILLKLRI
jgi:hypothetical protein